MFDFEVPNIDRESSFSFWATTGPEIRKKKWTTGSSENSPTMKGSNGETNPESQETTENPAIGKKTLLDPKCI